MIFKDSAFDLFIDQVVETTSGDFAAAPMKKNIRGIKFFIHIDLLNLCVKKNKTIS